MAFDSGTTGSEFAQQFLESLQNEFKNLSLETKKKYPQIKEVCCQCCINIHDSILIIFYLI